jgi:hypothetical protein
MSNHARGESEFLAGAERFVMRLTLGALAEIENGLGIKSLGEIGDRLKTLGTGDLALVASALLRGAGFALSPADVLKLETDLGTLIRAITDCFQAAGLGHAVPAAQAAGGTQAADTPAAISAAPRESNLARGDAEARREVQRPLAGASS